MELRAIQLVIQSRGRTGLAGGDGAVAIPTASTAAPNTASIDRNTLRRSANMANTLSAGTTDRELNQRIIKR